MSRCYRWKFGPQETHINLKACRVPGHVRRDKQIYIINGGVGCVEGWSNEDRLGFYKRF
ncbi:hypothetical protein NC653_010528 [Populus alba x Populus x berolinensis]|uniref:Uncharacterized protein n=1 Tax=Populus alba x Populus x berolinensis TaxID=444605 RepID=A0AAD6QZZ3_9ROSI|nr:hypothetical protein NC653_010528 [Populus alba x Populus x berolinensis]